MAAAPESPVWLASKGRAADADAAARRLWGPAAAAQLADTNAAAGSGKAAPVTPETLILSGGPVSGGKTLLPATRVQATTVCLTQA